MLLQLQNIKIGNSNVVVVVVAVVVGSSILAKRNEEHCVITSVFNNLISGLKNIIHEPKLSIYV